MTRVPPIYPVAIGISYVLSVYTGSGFTVVSLPRPIVAVLLISVAVQIILTTALRNRDKGAYFAALVLLALSLNLIGILALIIPVEIYLIATAVRKRSLSPRLWPTITKVLNVVVVLIVSQTAAQLYLDGRLQVPGRDASQRAAAQRALPDIYVILLDAYPRSDTLADDFGFDNEPFLDALRDQGFEVATEARSNYDLTALTLTSMFDMRHISEIPQIENAPSGQVRQYRLIAELLNSGEGLDALRSSGYEVVSVPSEFTQLALVRADRSLDGAQINAFEGDLITVSAARFIIPDQVRSFESDQHRDFIHTSLSTTAGLAAEHVGHPRFIFTHVLSPHAPPIFGPDGSPRDVMPCFPSSCSFWSGWFSDEPETATALQDQIVGLNPLVLDTVRSIMASSPKQPVIVVMSDHGHRNHPADHEEMLRSLFAYYAPGLPGLFPNDTTPINIIPRLLNAYAGTQIELETEESYWVDIGTVYERGFLDLQLIEPDR